MQAFNQAFERVIGHEGGYQCDTTDRGNWDTGVVGKGNCKGTKFGLAAMTYPTLDIKNLTLNQAKEIYYQDWWCALQMDKYPKALTYQMFDAAINHGSRRAVQFLQRAVGTLDDGVVGPKTLAAINQQDINDVLFKFLAERLEFFTNVPTWKIYCTGWTRRVAQNLRYAAEDN